MPCTLRNRDLSEFMFCRLSILPDLGQLRLLAHVIKSLDEWH